MHSTTYTRLELDAIVRVFFEMPLQEGRAEEFDCYLKSRFPDPKVWQTDDSARLTIAHAFQRVMVGKIDEAAIKGLVQYFGAIVTHPEVVANEDWFKRSVCTAPVVHGHLPSLQALADAGYEDLVCDRIDTILAGSCARNGAQEILAWRNSLKAFRTITHATTQDMEMRHL